MQVKGHTAAETKAAAERARLLIEEAEALGEPPEDPLLLFSVLYGFWVANYVVFNGDVCRDLAAQFLSLAEKQQATVPLIMGHRLMGASLLHTGDLAEGRAHYAQALALYDPAEQRPLVARFGGVDIRVAILANRSIGLWPLGYPEAALADAEQALQYAREVSQAPSLMFALLYTSITYSFCSNYAVAKALADELVAFGGRKGRYVLEGGRNSVSGFRTFTNRASCGRSPHDYLRNHRMAVDGRNGFFAVVAIMFGESIRGPYQIR